MKQKSIFRRPTVLGHTEGPIPVGRIPLEQMIHSYSIPVNLWSLSLISEVDALIDSGAIDNFISPTIINHFDISTQTLTKSLPIQNVDGMPNKIGEITQAMNLFLRFKGTHT